ncbi:Peptidyl-tRNA hydrolase [Ascosphaera apis ARSEF 7405]|uniref:peptidyl-tRNA hydrolase n=1 Tax=Ascosphaera apis ARSEF 7405 TaxID=392613 RepID=A0A167V4B4_9EURO|nr:Peptidyl-tRNA hydrolase [Ascosphaera apis ARSEF 7405]
MAFFIASLGNPAPYQLTRHSAGHILLRALKARLAGDPIHPDSHDFERRLSTPLEGPQTFPLPKSKAPVTLYESSSLMNVSGKNVQRNFSRWLDKNNLAPTYRRINPNNKSARPPKRERTRAGAEEIRLREAVIMPSEGLDRNTLRMMVLHDELDLAPGRIRFRRGGGEMSVKGHNGLKSIVTESIKAGQLASPTASASAAVNPVPGVPRDPTLVRIGLGIGRPGETRRPKDIADYVLSRVPHDELVRLLGLTEAVIKFLEDEAWESRKLETRIAEQNQRRKEKEAIAKESSEARNDEARPDPLCQEI